MGGGGDNVTNTGLGDDQFQTLADNQYNISDQIVGARSDATKAYEGIFDRFDTGETNLANLSSGVDSKFKSLNSSLSNLGTINSAERKAYAQSLLKDAANRQSGLSREITGVQGDVTSGFDDQSRRFDTLDSAVDSNLDAINQGAETLSDIQDTSNTINSNTAGLGYSLNDLASNQQNRFAATSDALSKGFRGLSSDVANSEAALAQGQGGLANDVSGLSGNLDTYATSIINQQGDMQQSADEFRSTFDDYVQRYGEDTALATQSRADLQEAQNSATAKLRGEIGSFANAASQGQADINQSLGSLADQTGSGFDVLSNAVEGGFSSVSMENQVAQSNMQSRISNVKDLLQRTGDNLDATTKAQYTALANSFDESGQLITSSIDAQGNTLSRSMDDQGRIIERKFDSTGNEIGRVQMDVGTMLDNAERYQAALTGQVSGLQRVTEGGFASVDDAIGTGLSETESTIMGGVGQLGRDTDAGITDIQELLGMGFNTQEGTLNTQARSLARIAANQSELDMNMRQDFKQVGDAFDEQGNLITNTVDSNGNTIARAVDDNGNLLLRAFDAQGRTIGDRVVNINKSLAALAELPTLAGASASMGNLSPALQAGAQGEVPTGGFMSPFAMTR